MKIRFCGAAKTVTGSCFLVETGKRKFLVDCGMFQGSMYEFNRNPFPFNPKDIDFVILTHAHIDHSGRIPLLVKGGFKGNIYCTSATAELLNVMLRDSGHIQEMESKWKNKKRQRKGLEPIEPLYTVNDAEQSTQYINPVSYGQRITIDNNISFIMKDAGHLLGSSIVCLEITEDKKTKKLVFTGDLGNFNIPILRDYELIDEADYVVIESTYGNRYHEMPGETNNLYDIIVNTISNGGNVILPTFAVGRTQEILYILNYYIDIEKRKRLKGIPIYLDSPLAREATKIFEKHKECYDEDALNLMAHDIAPLWFDNLHIVENTEESQALNEKSGVVIISSSGMCEAGRVKHHLKHNIWNKKSSVVFTGYQAEGTLGRRILDGEKRVSIFGEEMVVNANIYNVPGLSGHADLNGILNWISNIKNGVSKKIFIVHGEAEASENLKKEINNIIKVKTYIPELYEEVNLD